MIPQNKLRVQNFIQIILTILTWIATTTTITWIWKIHLIAQPIIFFATIHETIARKVGWTMIFLTGLDIMILMAITVADTRCIQNPNPPCVQQTIDSLPTTIIALLRVAVDIMQTYNLFQIRKQFVKQHIRMRIVTWFLFIQDAMFTIILQPTGIETIIFIHPVSNMFIFYVSDSQDKNKFAFVAIITTILTIIDSILLQHYTSNSYQHAIAQGLLMMYLMTDLILTYCAYQIYTKT